MIKAAFFDTDGTIYNDVIGVDFGKFLYDRGILEDDCLTDMKESFRRFEFHEIDFLEHARNLILTWAKYMRGKQKNTVEQSAKLFLDEGKAKINQLLLPIINNHKKEGDLLVAVSGSPIEIVSELGKLLGFNFTIASEFKVRDGIYTGEVVEPILLGKGRVDVIKNFAQEHLIDLNSSYAYGDSISDLEMLQIVGVPNVVNPKDDLRSIARKNKWRIIES